MFEPRWKVDSSHPLPAFPLKGRNEQPDVSCPCPIEMMFSKVKALVRGWGKRTAGELVQAVWDALTAVSSGDILGWFRHAHPGMVL